MKYTQKRRMDIDEMRKMEREAVGKRIGQVRRREELSMIAFAKRLQTPVITVEIAEHGIIKGRNVFAELIDISDKELIRLLSMISRAFNVPMEWLRYGRGDDAELEKYAKPPKEEMTLFIPVTVTAQGLVDEMKKTLLLVDQNPFHNGERAALQSEYFESIVQKYCLYEQYADQVRIPSSANLARREMLDSLCKARRGSVTKGRPETTPPDGVLFS